jgi:hypothetical protein
MVSAIADREPNPLESRQDISLWGDNATLMHDTNSVLADDSRANRSR